MHRPSETLPERIYGAGQVRDLDRIATEELGVPGYELMCRAGEAAFATLIRRWPAARRVAVYCGAGNNAGDGYVLARLLRERGYQARLAGVGDPERLRGDAAIACRDFIAAGGAVETPENLAVFAADVQVDALVGTGLERPLEGSFAAAVKQLNACDAPVLALDVPSGLHADSGAVLGVAARAAVTVTFVGLKQGLFLGEAPDYRGALELADLQLPASLADRFEAPMRRLTGATLRHCLPRRRAGAHKGDSGRLLLIGGAPGTSGAIRLAAEAGLRAGAGLVHVVTHPDSVAPIGAGRPELMCHGVQDAEELAPWLATADAVVLGPGLGKTAWARALWASALGADVPMVIDADGLNLLAEAPRRGRRWILTPHPGEAGRLLGSTAALIQADRLAAVRALADRYRGVIVLKGACSLVVDGSGDSAGQPVYVCDRGNPGMASGGMGDVLSGVLGALLAQAGDCSSSARAGVLLHALAGDDAAAAGERGMLASDLMEHIRRWANPR